MMGGGLQKKGSLEVPRAHSIDKYRAILAMLAIL